jgi:hypothetical protein
VTAITTVLANALKPQGRNVHRGGGLLWNVNILVPLRTKIFCASSDNNNDNEDDYDYDYNDDNDDDGAMTQHWLDKNNICCRYENGGW